LGFWSQEPIDRSLKTRAQSLKTRIRA